VSDAVPPAAGADPIDAAWTALLDRWSELERHDAFVALAATLDRLPDAAARYRAVESDPARADAAARGKSRVLTVAMARIDALPRTTPERARRGGRWLAPVAVLAFLLVVSFLLAAVTRRQEFVSPAMIVTEVVLVALLPWRRILR
jgi:hypothetical protein